MQYFTSNKKSLTLLPDGKKQGGEGSVYRIDGQPKLLAKIYHKDKATSDKQKKLEAMLSNLPKRLPKSCALAWPKDILFDSAGQFAGFIMPAAQKGSDVLIAYTHKLRRQRNHPEITRRTFYRMAINLCRALDTVHSMGHVIGDFNPNNILCREDGSVTLIDTDSFSIREPNTNETYSCEVGLANCIAPEIQNKDRSTILWKKEHDYFALAVHLFQMLMDNQHPFAATPLVGQAPAEYEVELITKGIYPHVRNGETKRDDVTDILPKKIKEAFKQTFLEGFSNPKRRLTSKAWVTLLKRELKSLRQCHACPEQYEAHRKTCPYCGAEQKKLIPTLWKNTATLVNRITSLPSKLFRPREKVTLQEPPKLKFPIPRPKPYVSWRKKFLIISVPLSGVVFLVSSGLASKAWEHWTTSQKPETHQPPQPEPVPVVQPTGKFPPLPTKRSQKEFRHLVHWITRVQLVPFRKGTVRRSDSGKSRYEYEAPSTHSKQAAVKQFRMMKAKLSRYATSNGTFREVPIPQLHQHFVTGCHFRTERDSILIVVEKVTARYRVVVIAQ